MSLHTKPTVFFSHSSKDKEAIKHLKDRFLKITGKTIEVFVSSDGQSIPLGHNWVKTIEDALGRAKLMFVFVTPNSINSPWLPFEAAFSYSRNVAVVPVVFGGLRMENLPMPLSLLQGFSVDNHEQLNNIIAKCNEAFNFEHDLAFTQSDMVVTSGEVSDGRAGLKQVAKEIVFYSTREKDPSDDDAQAIGAEMAAVLAQRGRKCWPWPLCYPGFSWKGQYFEVDPNAFAEDPSIEWCLKEIIGKTGGNVRVVVKLGSGYIADSNSLSVTWKLKEWMTDICVQAHICRRDKLLLLDIGKRGDTIEFEIDVDGFSATIVDNAISSFVEYGVISLTPGGQLEEVLGYY